MDSVMLKSVGKRISKYPWWTYKFSVSVTCKKETWIKGKEIYIPMVL
jgi:hypothetical protein